MIAQNYYYPPLHLVFPNIQPPTQTMKGKFDINDYLNKERAMMSQMAIDSFVNSNFTIRHPLEFQLLHPDAKLPTRATDGSAGLDLYCHSSNPYGQSMVEYDTGVAVAIPDGYVGLVVPRSSISGTSLRLANCVGVIDSDYRGPIKMRFDFNHESLPDSDRPYQHGDRIGQLVIVPCPSFSPVAVEELPATTRGQGGFGSSGR